MSELSEGAKAVLRDIEAAFQRRREQKKRGIAPRPGEIKPKTLCILCQDPDKKITRHHLIPRKLSKATRFQGEWVPLCTVCHVEVHQRFTNEELGERYYTAELLIAAMARVPEEESWPTSASNAQSNA